MKIAPSMLASDFTKMGACAEAIKTADWMHLDIMDGHFVPNISFGPDVVRALRPVSDLFFDVHLMLSHPKQYIQKFVAEKLPQIHIIEPQGTYLLWMDCSKLGLTGEQLEDLMLNKAHVWPDMGTMFGEKTGQFIRLALACPRSVVEEVMNRLEKAINEL